MSDTNQEPTMEEILASIRRIISEDDQPQPAAEAAAPEPGPDRPSEPNTADDEVLDLTDRVEPPSQAAPMETVGDLDVFPRDEAPPPAEPQYSPPPPAAAEPSAPAPASAARAPEPAPSWTGADDEGLVSRSSAETAAASFASLSQSLMMPQEGRSLEDLVREMMKPLLKDWLDQNLPAIVQRTVQEEVERIARARVR